MNSKPVPNPGTEEAQSQGCVCPVIDNHYGRGYRGEEGVFVFSMECPLHLEAKDAARRAQVFK